MHNSGVHAQPGELIPTTEVARMLGRDVRNVHRAVRRGELTAAVKLPGLRGPYLFRLADIEAIVRVLADEDTAA